MHVSRFPSRSSLARLVLACITGVALLAAACGGDDEAEPTPEPTSSESTPIPTATPFSTTPEPTIVASPTAEATATQPPVASGEEAEYTVEAGDTLFAIAERFETTVDAIMELNDIEDAALIFVGQVLTVRQGYAPEGSDTGGDTTDDTGGDDGTDAEDSGDGTTTDESGARIYVVQAGDTAYDIALQFDITVEALAAANGTTVDGLANLFVGEELIIP
jgi:LysM repeat protein